MHWSSFLVISKTVKAGTNKMATLLGILNGNPFCWKDKISGCIWILLSYSVLGFGPSESQQNGDSAGESWRNSLIKGQDLWWKFENFSPTICIFSSVCKVVFSPVLFYPDYSWFEGWRKIVLSLLFSSSISSAKEVLQSTVVFRVKSEQHGLFSVSKIVNL